MIRERVPVLIGFSCRMCAVSVNEPSAVGARSAPASDESLQQQVWRMNAHGTDPRLVTARDPERCCVQLFGKYGFGGPDGVIANPITAPGLAPATPRQ